MVKPPRLIHRWEPFRHRPHGEDGDEHHDGQRVDHVGVTGDPAVIEGEGQHHHADPEDDPSHLLEVGLPRKAVARAVEVQHAHAQDDRDERHQRPVEVEDEPAVDLHGRTFPAK
jgi:hypothetical protein